MKKESLNNVPIRSRAWKKNACNRILMYITRPKRNKLLWIFGCWAGEKYDDNSRYFFEYMLEKHKEISCYWFTKDERVFELLKKSKIPVIRIGTKQSIEIMKKAGFAFYTNGLDDFGYINYLEGCQLINLTHAVSGIKKDYYMQECYSNRLRKFLKKVKDYLYDWYSFDYTIVSSNEAKLWRMAVHDNYNENQFPLTGLPRNDLLRDKYFYEPNKPKFMEKDRVYISYLPTYRPYSNTVIRDLIINIVNDTVFMNYLKKNRIHIVIKFHYMDKTAESVSINSPNIIVLDKNTHISTQELLYFSEGLITDFSSACIDFSLKRKPVIIYAPDYDVYDEYNGIVDTWKPIYESYLVKKTFKEFENEVINCYEKGEANELTNKLISMYEDESIAGTSYCENVYGFIERTYNLREGAIK